jgi:hypothetical protein
MAGKWERKQHIVTLDSKWLTLHGERWLDDQGRLLDYWRVEKADSVIVIPRHQGHILLPHPQFRPGVNRPTLDLPGGRVPDGQLPVEAAPAILLRELGIPATALTRLIPLNTRGWIVNSSFSNQLLFGTVADIDAGFEPSRDLVGDRVSDDFDGVRALLARLECLQCSAVLQRYQAELG